MSFVGKEQYLHIPLPNTASQRFEDPPVPTRSKTTLYVEDRELSKLSFIPSATMPGVEICDDFVGVLQAIGQYANIGRRYPSADEVGLESDPTKRQPIYYTMVTAGDKLLAYIRADKSDVSESEEALLGDARLRGKVSLGFGGHTADEDRGFLPSLQIFAPGFNPIIRNLAALDRAQSSEWQEELAIGEKDVKKFQILGAFREVYTPEELADPDNIPVGAVHLGISAVASIDVDRVAARGLYLPKREIAQAFWIDVDKAEEQLNDMVSRGAELESWTEIMMHEFIPRMRERTTIQANPAFNFQ